MACGALNLLRLQLLAVRQHGIPVEQLGLESGSPLLASLKQKVRWIICWLCAAAWCPRGAAGIRAGESATRLTQAEGEMDNMVAVQQHGIPVEQLGLEPGSPILASLKQKVRWIPNMLAVRQHSVPVEQLGLELGSPLLASLKQKVRWIICWLCGSMASPWSSWVWSRGVRYSPHSSRR